MSAILFGSISTVADTSELQRQAFNQAFVEHGLDWQWDQDLYRTMLSSSGGQDRVAQYAASVGKDVDAKAVHETKSKIFRERLAGAEVAPRAGVVETIKSAKDNGWKVALVTTTSPGNISALLKALSPHVQSQDFDVIVDATSVERPKPDKAAYGFALERLGESAGTCVAIEDNPAGIAAAVAAGLTCVAFPNENTAHTDLAAAGLRVEQLQADDLRRLVHAA
jgi:HAD superfamily hydrolase (TIGR01509 family)